MSEKTQDQAGDEQAQPDQSVQQDNRGATDALDARDQNRDPEAEDLQAIPPGFN
jgi:hypothetical protein